MVSSVYAAQQAIVNPFQQRTENNSPVRGEERRENAGAATGAKESDIALRREDNFALASSRDSNSSGNRNASGSRGTLFDVTV